MLLGCAGHIVSSLSHDGVKVDGAVSLLYPVFDYPYRPPSPSPPTPAGLLALD